MEILTEIWAYSKANWYGILIAGGSVITALEFITRLTPTKKDDGFVMRMGKGYKRLLDFLKVPNNLIETPAAKAEAKKPVDDTPTI